MAADPYSAAFGAIASVATAPPAGPSAAESSGSIGGAAFDNSGWNITFGNNSGITSKRAEDTGLENPYVQYALIGCGFLLAWKYLKNR